ncbi:signal peptidase subunit-domain-containing protein [Mycena sp. CBHHK59/15]|nr:signal peptidase subunit-domain-containing protein [Mycena sp. CBHHK59/15]
MHSLYSRINNVSALLSSCVMALLGAIALSSMLMTTFEAPLKGGSVLVKGLKVVQAEQAIVNFQIDSAFLYLDVEYTNAKGVENSIVVWDRIVRRKSDARIHYDGKQKYYLRDLVGFRGASATYTLRYNLMPHVGALVYGTAGSTNGSIAFPPLITHV